VLTALFTANLFTVPIVDTAEPLPDRPGPMSC